MYGVPNQAELGTNFQCTTKIPGQLLLLRGTWFFASVTSDTDKICEKLGCAVESSFQYGRMTAFKHVHPAPSL